MHCQAETKVVSPLWSTDNFHMLSAGCWFSSAAAALASAHCPLPIGKVGNNFINCSTCSMYNVICCTYENIKIIICMSFVLVSRLFWACLFSSALCSTLSGADKCVCLPRQMCGCNYVCVCVCFCSCLAPRLTALPVAHPYLVLISP